MKRKDRKQPAEGGRLAASRSPFANYLHNRALSLREMGAPRGREWRSPVDRQGLIVDQTLLSDYRMGAVGSDGCGCGWIACYNALRLLGRPEPAARIIRELEPALALRGRLGTRAVALAPFFLRRGFRISLSGTRSGIDRRAAGAGANILYYLRAPRAGKLTAHFVAFSGSCGTDEGGETLYRFTTPSPRRSASGMRRRGKSALSAAPAAGGGICGPSHRCSAPEHPVFVCALCIHPDRQSEHVPGGSDCSLLRRAFELAFRAVDAPGSTGPAGKFEKERSGRRRQTDFSCRIFFYRIFMKMRGLRCAALQSGRRGIIIKQEMRSGGMRIVCENYKPWRSGARGLYGDGGGRPLERAALL